MSNIVLQIHEYDPARQLVTDIWEADNRQTLLKFLKARLIGGTKSPWTAGFADGYTYTVRDWNGDGKWDIQIAIPKGCKKPRPCVDGIDFLLWSPDGKHADGTMGKQAVIDAIVEAVQNGNPDDMEVTAEGEVVIYTGIIRRPDGTYHEKL
jgi:hypothetical protein